MNSGVLAGAAIIALVLAAFIDSDVWAASGFVLLAMAVAVDCVSSGEKDHDS